MEWTMRKIQIALCLHLVVTLSLISIWDVPLSYRTGEGQLAYRALESNAITIPPPYGSGRRLINRFQDLEETCGGGWGEAVESTMSFTHHQCRSNSYRENFDGVLATTMDPSVALLLPGLLSSFAQNNHGHFLFLVLGLDLTPQLISHLCTYLNGAFSNLSVEFYNWDSETISSLFTYKSKLKHVPIATMVRLLLPLVVPSDISNVVYMDIDTIVAGDLQPLWSGAICKPHKLCAKLSLKKTKGWLSHEMQCYVDIIKDFKAFNAGVVYMDLGHMRDWGLSPFAIYMSRTYNMNDQSILNTYASFETSFGQLDDAYNIFHKQDDSKFSADTAKIFHSAGSTKVWNTNSTWALLWKQHVKQQVLFVWSSLEEAEVPEHGIVALSSAASNTFGIPILCICATQQCERHLRGLSLPNVRVLRLEMPDLIAIESPLSSWFSKSPLIKIWSGPMFPDYLRMAMELQALYHYGGLLLDWRLKMAPQPTFWPLDIAWCHEFSAEGAILMHSPPRSHSLFLMMEEFVRVFDKFDPGLGELLRLPDNWTKGCSSASMFIQSNENKALEASYELLEAPAFRSASRKRHVGQMWLDLRSDYLRSIGNMGVNLGDEVQGLASIQWLPYIDRRVERDQLNATLGGGAPTLTFLNAWYGTRTMGWPPSYDIDPVLISMHVEPGVRPLFSSNASVEYLKNRQPIGARDTSTLEFLTSLGVEAYLSYCMTLTFQKMAHINKNPACRILTVDVDPAFTKLLPKEISPYICSASPKWVDVNGTGVTRNGLARYSNAYALLESYASAELVITSRLHTALPSAAFGTPVVLLLNKHMPGGGGAHDNQQRFSGFQELLHTFNMRDDGNASAFIENFPWSDPLPNPGHASLEKIRCQMFGNIIKSHPEMSDWIHFFGGRNITMC